MKASVIVFKDNIKLHKCNRIFLIAMALVTHLEIVEAGKGVHILFSFILFTDDIKLHLRRRMFSLCIGADDDPGDCGGTEGSPHQSQLYSAHRWHGVAHAQ